MQLHFSNMLYFLLHSLCCPKLVAATGIHSTRTQKPTHQHTHSDKRKLSFPIAKLHSTIKKLKLQHYYFSVLWQLCRPGRNQFPNKSYLGLLLTHAPDSNITHTQRGCLLATPRVILLQLLPAIACSKIMHVARFAPKDWHYEYTHVHLCVCATVCKLSCWFLASQRVIVAFEQLYLAIFTTDWLLRTFQRCVNWLLSNICVRNRNKLFSFNRLKSEWKVKLGLKDYTYIYLVLFLVITLTFIELDS